VAAEAVVLTELLQTSPGQSTLIVIWAVTVPFGGMWAQLKVVPEVLQVSEGATENFTVRCGRYPGTLTTTTTWLEVAGPLLVTRPVKRKYTGVEIISYFCWKAGVTVVARSAPVAAEAGSGAKWTAVNNPRARAAAKRTLRIPPSL
jgi:hypothetical protein